MLLLDVLQADQARSGWTGGGALSGELRVRFVSSYQGVSDFTYDHTGARVEAAWDYGSRTYFVRDELGRRVLEQYQTDKRSEWARFLRGKPMETWAEWGEYPTHFVVIDAGEWERRVYPNAVTL